MLLSAVFAISSAVDDTTPRGVESEEREASLLNECPLHTRSELTKDENNTKPKRTQQPDLGMEKTVKDKAEIEAEKSTKFKKQQQSQLRQGQSSTS
ncbi:hypothetical protein Tco_0700234 [Tanacetum coccineum]